MKELNQTIESYAVTSQLIDLIIRLPEQDQRRLLHHLEKQILEMDRDNSGDRPAKSDEYDGGNYVYWDLFKTHGR